MKLNELKAEYQGRAWLNGGMFKVSLKVSGIHEKTRESKACAFLIDSVLVFFFSFLQCDCFGKPGFKNAGNATEGRDRRQSDVPADVALILLLESDPELLPHKKSMAAMNKHCNAGFSTQWNMHSCQPSYHSNINIACPVCDCTLMSANQNGLFASPRRSEWNYSGAFPPKLLLRHKVFKTRLTGQIQLDYQGFLFICLFQAHL